MKKISGSIQSSRRVPRIQNPLWTHHIPISSFERNSTVSRTRAVPSSKSRDTQHSTLHSVLFSGPKTNPPNRSKLRFSYCLLTSSVRKSKKITPSSGLVKILLSLFPSLLNLPSREWNFQILVILRLRLKLESFSTRSKKPSNQKAGLSAPKSYLTSSVSRSMSCSKTSTLQAGERTSQSKTTR